MPIRLLRHTVVLCLLALLTGCAALTSREALEGHGDPDRWRAHKDEISALDAWQISGKVGIQAPKDSGSATLFWLQRRDYYDIRLSGPLGRGATRLTGHPGKIVLEIAGKGRYQASSPEHLLERELGWQLPVSHLLWWVRGLPAPDSHSQLTLDDNSRLIRLQQDDWRIEYQRYAEHDGHWLPERLKLYGKDLTVTLVIKDWQPRRLGF